MSARLGDGNQGLPSLNTVGRKTSEGSRKSISFQQNWPKPSKRLLIVRTTTYIIPYTTTMPRFRQFARQMSKSDHLPDNQPSFQTISRSEISSPETWPGRSPVQSPFSKPTDHRHLDVSQESQETQELKIKSKSIRTPQVLSNPISLLKMRQN